MKGRSWTKTSHDQGAANVRAQAGGDEGEQEGGAKDAGGALGEDELFLGVGAGIGFQGGAECEGQPQGQVERDRTDIGGWRRG